MTPLKTASEIVYLDTVGHLKSKRVANWTERIDKMKKTSGIEEAIKLGFASFF